jgi:hypothetical protein
MIAHIQIITDRAEAWRRSPTPLPLLLVFLEKALVMAQEMQPFAKQHSTASVLLLLKLEKGVHV